MSKNQPNRLAAEASPYLLQHALNPVDWYPWGDEAFETARTEGKPIFLSIGYAACHWCHVMERESFEDAETAALMNQRFVSIKVDREERPDVDSVYMDAVQALTGRGGWPLSAFLTPEGKPFYGGTYYPKEPAAGMPSFKQVLTSIADAWQDRRDEVVDQAGRVTDSISRISLMVGSEEPMGAPIAEGALSRLRASFDEQWGGFGGAPKFPQPMTLEFLLRQAARGEDSALEMLETTLDRMAAGGIHDQVAGGFSRYSTDERWHVPHFEKMLYDNAQLASVYARTWLLTRDDRWQHVARATLDYLLGEMRDLAGGFWSSQDADSEGVEGKFYVWSWDELVHIAGENCARAMGATPEGNWRGDEGPTNVLWMPRPLHEVAEELGVNEDVLVADVANGRAALRDLRPSRVAPATDDKVLASWNALAIRALAEAGRSFGVDRYIQAAVECAGFVLAEMRDQGGALLHSWRHGTPGPSAFCEDYALMATACLTLYETTFDLRWFEEARELGDQLLEGFHDEVNGGFFQTRAGATDLPVRPKDLYDNAVTGGNSAAAEAMTRLYLLTGEGRYRAAAEEGLRLVSDHMANAPTVFGTALCVLDMLIGPAREIAIVGSLAAPRTLELARQVTCARYLPNAVLAVCDPHDRQSKELVPLLQGREQVDGEPTAFVCEGFACQMPVTTPDALAEQLS